MGKLGLCFDMTLPLVVVIKYISSYNAYPPSVDCFQEIFKMPWKDRFITREGSISFVRH